MSEFLRTVSTTILAAFGAVQLLWSMFSDKPIIPFASNWLKSKEYSEMNCNFVIGLSFIVLALLVWKFSKKNGILQIGEMIQHEGVWCVQILNPNHSKTAKNVRVNILSITPPEKQSAITQISFPVRLMPKNDEVDTINPRETSLFKIFTAEFDWASVYFDLVTSANEKRVVFDFLKVFDNLDATFSYVMKISISADGIARATSDYLISIKHVDSEYNKTNLTIQKCET